MKVLLIIGIVLGALLLLLLLILLIRVDLILKYNEEDGFVASVRVLFFSFGGKKKAETVASTQKPKQQKKKKEKEKEKEKEKDEGSNGLILRALGFSHFSDKETVKRHIREDGVSYLVTETALSVRRLFQKLGYIVRHIRIKKLDLTCISGGEDPASAALDYGKTCAVLYPFLGYLESAVRSSPKKMSAEVRCDFDREKSVYAFDTVISLRTFHAVWAVLTLVSGNIVRSTPKEVSHE